MTRLLILLLIVSFKLVPPVRAAPVELNMESPPASGALSASLGTVSVELKYIYRTPEELGWGSSEGRIQVPLVEIRQGRRLVMALEGEASGFTNPPALESCAIQCDPLKINDLRLFGWKSRMERPLRMEICTAPLSQGAPGV